MRLQNGQRSIIKKPDLKLFHLNDGSSYLRQQSGYMFMEMRLVALVHKNANGETSMPVD
jgi:hypothetical protein